MHEFICRNEVDYGHTAGSLLIGRAHCAASTDAQTAAEAVSSRLALWWKWNLGPPCKEEMPVLRPASMPAPTVALREEVEAAVVIDDVDTAGVEARSAVAAGDIAIIVLRLKRRAGIPEWAFRSGRYFILRRPETRIPSSFSLHARNGARLVRVCNSRANKERLSSF